MDTFSIVIPMFSVKHHGGTRILLQLANLLATRGHDITVLVPEDKYDPIYPVHEKVKIQYTSRVGGSKLFYFKTLLEFIFKIPKSDFILANFFPTFYSSFLAGKLKKGKVIYFPQGIGETHPSFRMPLSQVLKLGEKLSFKFTVPTIVTTEWQKNTILRINKNANLKKISLGLLEGAFYPDSQPIINKENKKRLLYFPRKDKNKGLYDFLKALNILMKENLEFELWLVSKEKESLDQFSYLGDKLKIKIFSPANDEELRRIYSSAYLLINSSWAEGFCLPALEAMACGIPVVITDSGGPKEYAKNNHNCLMTPSKNPELLAQAIEKLLTNEKLRNKLAVNALKTGEKFKFSNFAEEFEKFLINL